MMAGEPEGPAMSAFIVTATVRPDGSLTVDQLPFAPGQRVEVVVRPAADDPTEGGKYPLRDGTPYKYDDPFEPACDPDDWEANR
jgi:FtsP/CotA-like multicopper oxidase with cupredoxin domain